jgi:dipeptidase E
MGETRDIRIKEFHAYNTIPVLGLRRKLAESRWRPGNSERRVLSQTFQTNQIAEELETGTDISYVK